MIRQFIRLFPVLALLCIPGVAASADAAHAKHAGGSKQADPVMIARGRYMVVTGHCNNCHTADYGNKQGQVPQEKWLLGGNVGHRGPWGTTYPSNLRITASNMTEQQWVDYMKQLRTRPPMPWWSVNETTERDTRAMYRFIKSLGPVGEPAPSFLTPDKEPSAPFVTWPASRAPG